MGQVDGLKVTAWLSSPLCGDAPMLDGILELEMLRRQGGALKPLRRDDPAPPVNAVHIPIPWLEIGGENVPRCSSPILLAEQETVEYTNKRLAVEHSGLMAESERRVVAVGNATFKSYHLPRHIRRCDRVVWFTVGKRQALKSLVRRVRSIGRKRSHGYGRVDKWTLEPIDVDWSWFVATEKGRVLMRPLPLCLDTQSGLRGARRDFGSVQPPYFHPGRYMDRVVPC